MYMFSNGAVHSRAKSLCFSHLPTQQLSFHWAFYYILYLGAPVYLIVISIPILSLY